jgi:hypothetical protein
MLQLAARTYVFPFPGAARYVCSSRLNHRFDRAQ